MDRIHFYYDYIISYKFFKCCCREDCLQIVNKIPLCYTIDVQPSNPASSEAGLSFFSSLLFYFLSVYEALLSCTYIIEPYTILEKMIAFNLSRKQIRKEYWRKQNDEKLKGQHEREKREIDGYSW